MKLTITRAEGEISVSGSISPAKNYNLPSIRDGWRFNFEKYSRLPGYKTYVLATEASPETIEGCLIFQLKNRKDPYIAFLEIAPHNRGSNKKYLEVAGCLLAFASYLSFVNVKSESKGWLALDVFEEKFEDQEKLISLYTQKYGAIRLSDTTLIIPPQQGKELISNYLNIKV